MEGNTPFRLWKCSRCGAELDESDGYIAQTWKEEELGESCIDTQNASWKGRRSDGR